jgi:hypothetical protein
MACELVIVAVETIVTIGISVGVGDEEGAGVKVNVGLGDCVAVGVFVNMLTACGGEVAWLVEATGEVPVGGWLVCELLQLVNSTKELIRMNKPSILFEMCMTLLLD